MLTFVVLICLLVAAKAFRPINSARRANLAPVSGEYYVRDEKGTFFYSQRLMDCQSALDGRIWLERPLVKAFGG